MTTQVPALSAITFGHASHSSVRNIGPSTSAFRAGSGNGGSGVSSSSTGSSATPISDISSPASADLAAVPSGFLAPFPGDSMCVRRMGRLRGGAPSCLSRLRGGRALEERRVGNLSTAPVCEHPHPSPPPQAGEASAQCESRSNQPIDQTKGGLPPADGAR